MGYIRHALVAVVKDLVEETGRPARTNDIAARLKIGRSTARAWLVMAELSGLLRRFGERRGWLPIAGVKNRLDALDRSLVSLITQRFEATGKPMSTHELAQCVMWSIRQVQYRLAALECARQVRREQFYGGWYPDIPNEVIIDVLVQEIRTIKRNTGRPAQTMTLAMRIHRPERTTLYWLNKGVQRGDITQDGKRGGWLAAASA